MGSNLKGQLGIQDLPNSGNSDSVGSPSLVEKLKYHTVVTVSCGFDTTTCVTLPKESGQTLNEVWAWGSNKVG